VSEDDPLFTAKTPVPWLPPITLLRSTWERHILPNHSYMSGKEMVVRSTISRPSVVMPGISDPANLIFVNMNVTTSKGHPLTVIVSPQKAIVLTALFNRSYRTIDQEMAIWKP